MIEAGKVNRQYYRDLLAYRELFLLLAWRDILVRYKQTIIGIAWSVLRPLLTMIVFTIVFGRLAKMPSDGAPYPILVFAALLPWQFFSNTVSEGGNSLISNASMISKVYFPRIIIPTTAMIVSLIDFLISILILSALMARYQFVPTWRVVFLPLFLGLAAITLSRRKAVRPIPSRPMPEHIERCVRGRSPDCGTVFPASSNEIPRIPTGPKSLRLSRPGRCTSTRRLCHAIGADV